MLRAPDLATRTPIPVAVLGGTGDPHRIARSALCGGPLLAPHRRHVRAGAGLA